MSELRTARPPQRGWRWRVAQLLEHLPRLLVAAVFLLPLLWMLTRIAA